MSARGYKRPAISSFIGGTTTSVGSGSGHDDAASMSSSEEFASLVAADGDNNDLAMPLRRAHMNNLGAFFRRGLCVASVVVVVLVGAIGMSLMRSQAIAQHDQPKSISLLQCPNLRPESAQNDKDEIFEEYYGHDNDRILHNLTGFYATFHDEIFDYWSRPYDAFKQSMYEWKANYIAPYLHDGASIFESACGVGLNLYMTLDIAREVRPDLRDIVVSGNEYLASSAQVANAIWNAKSSPFAASVKAAAGSICAADSGNLSYIPNDTFDVVFTGYVSPLSNPLNLNNETFDGAYAKMKQLCSCAADDWQCQTLRIVMQQRQDDWFGRWVGEMVRIAKPGAPVLMESVADAYCDALNDWGGVSRTYWSPATAARYGWPVNASSFQVVAIEEKQRYHVAMQKIAG